MKLIFNVNENYLALRLLASEVRKNPLIKELQEYAKSLHPNFYYLAMGRIFPRTLKNINDYKNIPEFYDSIKKEKAFLSLLKETLDFKNKCELEWNDSLEKTEGLIKKLAQLDLNREMQVFVVHHDLSEGMYLGEGEILWGHQDIWPNYSVIYLWHEVLHEYLGYGDVSHALIQMITDNELRKQLNGDSYPPFEGHPYLFDLMNKILPLWNEYLNSPDDQKNFKDLYRKCENIESN
jgi:hypothetical protein